MKPNLVILIVIFFLVVGSRFLPMKQLDEEDTQPRIVGGIVPHHLYVKNIIGNFFVSLPKADIDNIIILGPNHLEVGNSNIIWSPSFSDQSYSDLLPFIQSTYGKSIVTPIVIKRDVSLAECHDLATKILQLPGPKLVVASIDFSHYLRSEVAEKNDQITLAMIANRDYEGILRLSSDYLDSPGALVTALIYFDAVGAGKAKMLDHTNSGRIGNPYAPSTSYFSIIFYGDLESSSTPNTKPLTPVTLLFIGDVMLGRSVNERIQSSQDPSWPFIYVQDVLRSADIAYINLESPLVANCPITNTGMKFCGAAENALGLVSSGIDIASLANNHATNYGASGLAETIEILSANDIAVTGIAIPTTLERNGYNYTFLSFNDVGRYEGINQTDSGAIYEQISAAKSEDNLLIVTFHWGEEYQSTPSARQKDMARRSVEAGADLVIGAHPHWIQSSEIYQGKPIYYSLGNFVFDQEWSKETKRGLAVRFTYLKDQLLKTEELPVQIENFGQPHWL